MHNALYTQSHFLVVVPGWNTFLITRLWPLERKGAHMTQQVGIVWIAIFHRKIFTFSVITFFKYFFASHVSHP